MVRPAIFLRDTPADPKPVLRPPRPRVSRRPSMPQQSRGLETRFALMKSAAECLERRGYIGTTVAAVAAGANVGEGSVFRYFPSKNALLAAAVERTLEDLRTWFIVRAGELTRPTTKVNKRVQNAVKALWSIFCEPRMRTIFEVYVAARTDEELGELLEPVLAEHRAKILELAAAVIPEASKHKDFAFVVDTIVYAMQGTVLGMFGDSRQDPRHLEGFLRLADREVLELLR